MDQLSDCKLVNWADRLIANGTNELYEWINWMNQSDIGASMGSIHEEHPWGWNHLDWSFRIDFDLRWNGDDEDQFWDRIDCIQRNWLQYGDHQSNAKRINQIDMIGQINCGSDWIGQSQIDQLKKTSIKKATVMENELTTSSAETQAMDHLDGSIRRINQIDWC